MRTKIATLVAALSLLAHSGAFAADSEILSVSNPCTSKERWGWSSDIEPEVRSEFEKLVTYERPAARSFGDGLAYRRGAESLESKIFGEYWVSRALLRAKLVHAAFRGFGVIAAYEPTRETAAVVAAAVGCLNRIAETYPSLSQDKIPVSQVRSFFTLGLSEGTLQPVREYAGIRARAALAERAPVAEVQAWISMLRGSPADEALTTGLFAASRSDHAAAVQNLTRFLAAPGASGTALVKYANQARLVLARSYFGLGQYDQATAQYKKMDKSANEISLMLQELAWSSLQAGKYGDATGAAINLESGLLRKTFAPEAPMITAMAMNELCQFPEALKAIDGFRVGYRDARNWLGAWATKKTPLYGLAMQYVKRLDERTQANPSQVPDRVASEWIRSNALIADQEEIRLFVRERDWSAAATRTGSAEKRRLAQQIRTLTRELKEQIAEERSELKTYQPGFDWLSPETKGQLTALTRLVRGYRRMLVAGPAWRSLVAQQDASAPAAKRELVARINRDLEARSLKMLAQLDDVAENNHLIEVEIYNGASHDMIFQNAHPDYDEDLAKDLADKPTKPVASKVWNWGKVATSNNGAEVWEDELGSFRADLFDNCSSKDRYLALLKKEES